MRFLTYYFFIFANLIIANDKGMDLFNNGNYKEAAEYYSSILKERGEDNAASFNLGASQYYMEDNVSALKMFEQALGSKDRMLQSKALYNMARILQDQNELDKSLSLYKKSLELNPKDIDSKINYELLKKMIKKFVYFLTMNTVRNQSLIMSLLIMPETVILLYGMGCF